MYNKPINFIDYSNLRTLLILLAFNFFFLLQYNIAVKIAMQMRAIISNRTPPAIIAIS